MNPLTMPAPAAGPLAEGFVCVGSTADVPVLEGRSVEVAGRRIAVFRSEAGFSAVDAACPHRGGPLADGLVAEGSVTCPLHGWRVDLTSGKLSCGGAGHIAIHDAIEHEGRIYVRIARA